MGGRLVTRHAARPSPACASAEQDRRSSTDAPSRGVSPRDGRPSPAPYRRGCTVARSARAGRLARGSGRLDPFVPGDPYPASRGRRRGGRRSGVPARGSPGGKLPASELGELFNLTRKEASRGQPRPSGTTGAGGIFRPMMAPRSEWSARFEGAAHPCASVRSERSSSSSKRRSRSTSRASSDTRSPSTPAAV